MIKAAEGAVVADDESVGVGDEVDVGDSSSVVVGVSADSGASSYWPGFLTDSNGASGSAWASGISADSESGESSVVK